MRQAHRRSLQGMMHRHASLLMPYLQKWLREAGKEAALSELVAAIGKETAGDGKYKAYMSLLAGVINAQVQSMIEGATDVEEIADLGLTERQLSRVEDMAVLMLRDSSSSPPSGQHRLDYLMLPSTADPDYAICAVKRMAPAARLASVSEVLRSRTEVLSVIQAQAAYVMQSLWRRRRAVKVPVSNRKT